MPTNFSPEDRLQKTWIPEGTQEYKEFKHVTDENNFLAALLKEKFALRPGELLLDVGGREGDIGIKLQTPEYFHLIDPDPTITISFSPGLYLREKIQNIELTEKYKLIICSHVLGYLGTQHVQDEVFKKLIDALAPGGTLVLFYNTNTGYMADLLEFSKKTLSHGHYDYFKEELFSGLDVSAYAISHQDVSFGLNYPSYEDLARCCWFLFGAMDQDIEGVSAKFLPKLKRDLKEPVFPIEERVTFITKV